jgi:hypothetical protein
MQFTTSFLKLEYLDPTRPFVTLTFDNSQVSPEEATNLQNTLHTFQTFMIQFLSYNVTGNTTTIKLSLHSETSRVEEQNIGEFRNYLESLLTLNWTSFNANIIVVTPPTIYPSLENTVFWAPVILLIIVLITIGTLLLSMITKRELYSQSRKKDNVSFITTESCCIALSAGELVLRYGVPSTGMCQLSQTLTWMSLGLSQGYKVSEIHVFD